MNGRGTTTRQRAWRVVAVALTTVCLAVPTAAAGASAASPTAQIPGSMTPTVAYIIPTQGPASTTVAVYGAGFTTTQAVYFGSNASSSVLLMSDTELMAAAPAGAGTVPVTVTSQYGTSAATPKAQFTYTQPAAPPPLAPVTTSDGGFNLTVPPGTPSAPTVTESCVAPANLPAHMRPIGCLYDLSGPALRPAGTLTLQYNPSSLNGLSPNRLCVYALTGASGWHPVPSRVNADHGTVTATASGPAVIALLLDTQTFPDLGPAAWARTSIDALLAAGVIAGRPNGTFAPNEPVSRAEFTKMLALATGVVPESGATPFTDVPQGAWYAPYVVAEVAAKVVQGETPTTFGPDDPVTREQMAALLDRALNLPSGATVGFTDVEQIDAYALPGVEAVVATGYMQGFPDQTFRPLAVTTRAQAAAVLAAVWAHAA